MGFDDGTFWIESVGSKGKSGKSKGKGFIPHSERQCFNCGETGHIAINCTTNWKGKGGFKGGGCKFDGKGGNTWGGNKGWFGGKGFGKKSGYNKCGFTKGGFFGKGKGQLNSFDFNNFENNYDNDFLAGYFN